MAVQNKGLLKDLLLKTSPAAIGLFVLIVVVPPVGVTLAIAGITSVLLDTLGVASLPDLPVVGVLFQLSEIPFRWGQYF